MYSESIRLIGETKNTNEYGDVISDYKERQVFAKTKSVKQGEFYQAKAVGLAPEIVFILADYMDYEGEKKLKYAEFENEEVYSIIRTYRTGRELELICKRGVD